MQKKVIILIGLLLLAPASCVYTKSWSESLKQSAAYTALANNTLLTAAVVILNGPTIVKGSHYAFRKAKGMLMRTHAGFYISRYYTKLKSGTDFSFNTIIGDNTDQTSSLLNHAGIILSFDEQGALSSINDGKKTPLVLGSIPDKQSHIEQLKKGTKNSSEHTQSVGIYTLNEDWECDAAGLFNLVSHNKKLTQFLYPSPDFSAPSFIDVLRAVRDLEHRDSHNHQVALVHCKAGRGRSATMVAAYIAHVAQKAHVSLTVSEIERYLKKRRPQVSMNQQQKNILTQFIEQLRNAGSFENLYKRYKAAVEKRDEEVQCIIARNIKLNAMRMNFQGY